MLTYMFAIDGHHASDRHTPTPKTKFQALRAYFHHEHLFRDLVSVGASKLCRETRNV